jgi:SHS2 domain-containing protein
MPNRYRLETVDHTADLGLVARAESLPELFEACAYGMFDLMAEPEAYQPEQERRWEVQAPDLESLLVNWLRELLFSFDVEGILWIKFQVEDVGEDSPSLVGRSWGVSTAQVQFTGPGVKAVTYHGLDVRREDDGWRASFIVDV